MKARNFVINIEKGRFAFTSEDQKSMFTQFLSQFEGKKVVLTVDERLPKRSQSQHNYYHLYLDIIAEETGHSHDELHAYFKGKHLTTSLVDVLGAKVRMTKSTTDLSKTDFGNFLDRICAETNIPLPDPSLAGYISN